jgi:Sec-independent protein secretion pathway component TatC
MFYIKEIQYRLQYLGSTFFFVLFILYQNKDLLLFVLTFNISSYNSNYSVSGIDYFIYTHPIELFTAYYLVLIYASVGLVLPFGFWHLLDFLKSSLTVSNHLRLFEWIRLYWIFIYFFNAFCFLACFPSFWKSYELLNASIGSQTSLNFFLELKLLDYLTFVGEFLYCVNLNIFSFVGLSFILSYCNLKNLSKFGNLLKFASISYVTIISPSDALSQISILIFLTFCFEYQMYQRIIELKKKKLSRLTNKSFKIIPKILVFDL